MKVISIPIKSHTPIRRRPSEYLSAWVKATDFPKGAYIPVNGRSNAPIVHTGTTKVTKLQKEIMETSAVASINKMKEAMYKREYLRVGGFYELGDEPNRLTPQIENAKWGELGKKLGIEVHKRPNILKRIKNWRKR